MDKSIARTPFEIKADYIHAEIKARFSQTEIYALCEDVIRSKLEYGGDAYVSMIDELIEAYLKYHTPEDILIDVVDGVLDEYLSIDELGDNDE